MNVQVNIFFAIRQRFLLACLLLLHTIAAFYYIAQQNITFDEPHYIEYAKRWLHGHPKRVEPLDDSKSPVIAICWIPRIVKQLINPDYRLTDYGRKDQAAGRYMMILFSYLAALYVYRWCKDLYGIKGWRLPLLLLLFDPLYLSYSVLITTDLACGAILVALLYHFRKFLLTAKTRHLYAAAFFTGMAIVTKQAMLFVLLLLPALSFIFWTYNKQSRLWITKKSLNGLLIFSLLILLVINLTYYFYHSFISLGHYAFESQTLINLQSKLSFLSWLPLPLPEPYVQSIDMIKAHAEYGGGKALSTYNGVYILGASSADSGFWYYYIVTFFYKMPAGILWLLCLAVVLLLKKFNEKNFFVTYIFILVPIAFYWILLSFFNTFQTGIRHLLLTFPLMYIGIGKLLYEAGKMKKTYRLIIAGMISYSFISVLYYYPFIIPYTNELAGDKKKIYKIMIDSSVDYGQSDSSAAGSEIINRGFTKPPNMPGPGKYAISIGNLFNTNNYNGNPHEWLQKMKPTGIYRNVVLLYNISGQDLKEAGF